MSTKINQETLEGVQEVLEEVSELGVQMERVADRLDLMAGSYSYPELASLLLQAHEDLREERDHLEESRNALKAEKDNLERALEAAVQTSVERPGAIEDGARGLRRYYQEAAGGVARGGSGWVAAQDAARAVLEGVKGGHL